MTGYADGFILAAEVIAKVLRTGTVPTPASIMYTDHTTDIVPLQHKGPIKAILEWSMHLVDHRWRAWVHGDVTELYLNGFLGELPLQIRVQTHQLIPGIDLTIQGDYQPVSAGAIMSAAQGEKR